MKSANQGFHSLKTTLTGKKLINSDLDLILVVVDNDKNERFFHYMEDVDLVRRIRMIGQTIIYPKVTVFHQEQRSCYKSFRPLLLHIIFSIKYFNKWGWFFDKRRKHLNNQLKISS